LYHATRKKKERNFLLFQATVHRGKKEALSQRKKKEPSSKRHRGEKRVCVNLFYIGEKENTLIPIDAFHRHAQEKRKEKERREGEKGGLTAHSSHPGKKKKREKGTGNRTVLAQSGE